MKKTEITTLEQALAKIEEQEKQIKKLKTMYSNTIEIKIALHDRTKILEKQVKYLEREIKKLRGDKNGN